MKDTGSTSGPTSTAPLARIGAGLARHPLAQAAQRLWVPTAPHLPSHIADSPRRRSNRADRVRWSHQGTPELRRRSSNWDVQARWLRQDIRVLRHSSLRITLVRWVGQDRNSSL